MGNQLTHKQQVFVEEYLKTWNATEAARRAGYSTDTARQMGSENLAKPYIKAVIEQRLAAYSEATGPEVAEMAQHFRQVGERISRGVKQKRGIVYLIREEHGAVKIGKTINLEQRFSTLAAQVPYDLELLLAIESDDIHALEAELHRRYAASRINGEWFRLSEEELEEIRREFEVF
jgi:hypothetical protein